MASKKVIKHSWRAVIFLCIISLPHQLQAIINVPTDYLTIQEALDNAVSGETVLVQPGTYRETLDLNISKEYNLMGIDRATTIVDGEDLRPTIRINTDRDVSVSGLTFKNSIANGIAANIGDMYTELIISDCIIDTSRSYGIYLNGWNTYSFIIDCEIVNHRQRAIFCYFIEGIIRGNYITNNNGAIYLEYLCELGIYDNIIEYNVADNPSDNMGVVLRSPFSMTIGNRSVDISNNIIQFNQADGDGVIFGESMMSSLIKNNFIYRNSSQGTKGTIFIDNGTVISSNTIIENTSTLGAGGIYADTNDIFNNIIMNNSNYGYIGRTGDVRNNNFYGNTPAEIFHLSKEYHDIDEFNKSDIGIENNISCDPDFVTAGDYHIAEFSCCIDRGTSEDAPSNDLDDNLRPFGLDYDIGADEYIIATVPISETTHLFILIIYSVILGFHFISQQYREGQNAHIYRVFCFVYRIFHFF